MPIHHPPVTSPDGTLTAINARRSVSKEVPIYDAGGNLLRTVTVGGLSRLAISDDGRLANYGGRFGQGTMWSNSLEFYAPDGQKVFGQIIGAGANSVGRFVMNDRFVLLREGSTDTRSALAANSPIQLEMYNTNNGALLWRNTMQNARTEFLNPGNSLDVDAAAGIIKVILFPSSRKDTVKPPTATYVFDVNGNRLTR